MMRAWLAIVCLLLFPVFAQAQEEEPVALENPFAGFETLFLSNGLKVWYKHMPDEPNVYIAVSIPVGSDHDPIGKEELAHFTEHMLFSDHMGRTEEEIKREVEDLGGLRNGLTYWDRTTYYVTLDRQHGQFALDWLYRIVSPHEMPPELVKKQREPVAVELAAAPRELLDWIGAYYIFPHWLRPSGFWEREFGLGTRWSRDYYPHRSLHAITSEDLRWFYETYYVPSTMTLIVVGDFERGALLESLDDTFATLPERPAPVRDIDLHNPKRPWQSVNFSPRANVYYSYRMKLYGVSTEDHYRLLFLQDLLNLRLNQKLRYGDRKAVYSIRASVVQRQASMHFHINGEIKKEEYDYARQVIDEELTALRSGSLSEEEFATDQQAVARKLRVNNRTSSSLGWWMSRKFYDPTLHRDFPDPVSFYEKVNQQDLAAFMQQRFILENRVRHIRKPWPVNQAILACIALTLLAFSVELARRTFTRPADMTRIRYVARFKIPPMHLVFVLGFLGLLAAVLLRLLVYAVMWGYERIILGVESFVVQGGTVAVLFFGAVYFGCWLVAHIPSKLLVFEDHLRVKYRPYRSRMISAEDIDSVALCGFRDVWLSRRLLTTVPLAFGVFTPAICLKLRRGRSYFFRVRENEECREALNALLERTSMGAGTA